jgi:hypothetical protein
MNTNTNTNHGMSNMHMNNMNSSNNKTTRREPVPDLLSFDSWDYDSNMVSATSSFTTDTSLAPSYDENDPHQHHRHSASASVSSSFSAPVFATDDIHIQVSGASFILNPTVFRQLEKLPWSLVNNTNDDNNVVYSLGTSPDLFEILLNYVLFESLPNMKLLSQSDIEELEPMVLITGLQGLQNHLEKKDLKNKLLGSRSFRRNASTALPAHQLHQQLERHISTNSMNNGSSNNGNGDDKDNNKLLRRQISAPVLGSSSTHETIHTKSNSNNIKGMASRFVEAVARRRPSQQQQQKNQQGRKLTHAQCVASDLVD